MTRGDTSSRALALLLLLGGCAAFVSVPDSGRGLGVRADGEALALPAVPPGAALPFGEIATACGVTGAALGQLTDELAGYAIHDTAPGTTAPRTHYVTGFRDGCPRQVTAALAVFGDPVTHETFRYQTSSRPYGPVDRAYEEIKGRVCGVPAGEPCGASMDRLAADTAFLSLYPEFGDTASTDVLFYDGEVVATDG